MNFYRATIGFNERFCYIRKPTYDRLERERLTGRGIEPLAVAVVRDYKYAVTTRSGFQIICSKLNSERLFEFSGRPAFAAMLNFDGNFALCSRGSDDYVRFVTLRDLGFAMGVISSR